MFSNFSEEAQKILIKSYIILRTNIKPTLEIYKKMI